MEPSQVMYVFSVGTETTGLNWVRKSTATGDVSGQFIDLSADGNIVAIAAPGNDTNGVDSGQTRFYRWDGTSWELLGQPIDGEGASDLAGSLSMTPDGQSIVIGSIYNTGSGPYAGHARVFDFDGSSWIQRGLDLDAEAENDESGWRVVISSDGMTVMCSPKK